MPPIPCDCRDPKASDEEEYLENLFDVLCICLMQPQTRSMFYKQEGTPMHLIPYTLHPTVLVSRLLVPRSE